MRYPLGPLEQALGTAHSFSANQPAPDSTLAAVLGVGRGSVVQARKLGLSANLADDWSCRGGLHPANVWESWEQDTLEPACEWCGRASITPTNPTLCGRGLPCRTYDKRRAECWWARLDRYRESVVIEEAEVA